MKQLLTYRTLILLAIFFALAPFYPEPHLVEKLRMLANGTLTRPIDIFDLFWHSWPIFLLLGRVIWDFREGRKQ